MLERMKKQAKKMREKTMRGRDLMMAPPRR